MLTYPKKPKAPLPLSVRSTSRAWKIEKFAVLANWGIVKKRYFWMKDKPVTVPLACISPRGGRMDFPPHFFPPIKPLISPFIQGFIGGGHFLNDFKDLRGNFGGRI